MRNMRINKQKIYIANRIGTKEDYGTPEYDVPFLFNENVNPVSGDSDIKDIGDRVFKMYESNPQKKYWKGKIKEGDVAYLEGTIPEGESYPGEKANFKVSSVRETLNTMQIFFERLA